MYGFADSQEVELLGTYGIIVAIVVASIFILGLSFFMRSVMAKVEARDILDSNGDARQVEEEDQKWVDTCEEAEDDVFSLTVGFLIVLLLRNMIRGEVQAYEPGKIGAVTQSEANKLLMCSGVATLLVIVGAICPMHELIGESHLRKRALTNVQHLNSMVMAWGLLFWAEWQLYVSGWEHTTMGGCIVVAISVSTGAFISVILLSAIPTAHTANKFGKRAAKSIVLALGLLIGFTWERAFDVAFEELEEHYAEHHSSKWLGHAIVTCVSLVLTAIVAPAWRHYILPRALEENHAPKVQKAHESAQSEAH